MDTDAHPRSDGSVAIIALPALHDAPARARRRVAPLLDGWGGPGDRDDAVLLTSELVANAVCHGPHGPHRQVTVLVARDRTELRVRVHNTADPGAASALTARTPDPGGEHGRGLLLVDAIADHWGVRRGRLGTTVGFTLRARHGGR